jgi:hypothetical protein
MLSGWGFIQEIAKSLSAGTVVPTLGNHDVLSRKPSDDPFKLAKNLSSPKFPISSEELSDLFWSRGFFSIENDQWRVLAVNSVMSHNNEISEKRGLITTKQLGDISSYLEAMGPKSVQIAVCHHHPLLHEDIGLGTDDVMENGGLLLQLLAERGFSLLIHGHKHHPKLTCVNALPVFAAGSFSAGMTSGLASRTRNLFHFISPNTVHLEIALICGSGHFASHGSNRNDR